MNTIAPAGGSVSTGTLSADHLADAFLGEIDRVRLHDRISADLTHRAQLLACSAASPVAPDLPADASETIEELIEVLNSAANPGWFFGAHPGDGADFGFWQEEEPEPQTLRQLLIAAGSRWVATDWTGSSNKTIDDIINRFDDCPEGLQDFDHSDWVNLAECYTRDLLRRWEQQEDDIKALFEDYCEAIGATSALEVLQGETIEDPDDMAAAMVNHAMTWGARMLLDEIQPDR